MKLQLIAPSGRGMKRPMTETASNIPVIVVCGPTGIGKTTAAIELAGAVGGEIISADSMQIYRYMDIGTAKPTAEEQARVRHHLVDIVDPDAPFDAARFSEMARQTADALAKKGAGAGGGRRYGAVHPRHALRAV